MFGSMGKAVGGMFGGSKPQMGGYGQSQGQNMRMGAPLVDPRSPAGQRASMKPPMGRGMGPSPNAMGGMIGRMGGMKPPSMAGGMAGQMKSPMPTPYPPQQEQSTQEAFNPQMQPAVPGGFAGFREQMNPGGLGPSNLQQMMQQMYGGDSVRHQLHGQTY